MDRTAFRERLAAVEDGDKEALVAAIQGRVRSLSGRHLDIQERIEETESARKELQRRLREAEAEIVAQADAAVEADVDSIGDVEALPGDAGVSFDPELLAEVEEIRERARSNHRRTADEGGGLRAELAANSDELELHQSVLADLEDGEATVADARARLLAFLDDEGAADADASDDPDPDDTPLGDDDPDA